jgi:hypothetical protein
MPHLNARPSPPQLQRRRYYYIPIAEGWLCLAAIIATSTANNRFGGGKNDWALLVFAILDLRCFAGMQNIA